MLFPLFLSQEGTLSRVACVGLFLGFDAAGFPTVSILAHYFFKALRDEPRNRQQQVIHALKRTICPEHCCKIFARPSPGPDSGKLAATVPSLPFY